MWRAFRPLFDGRRAEVRGSWTALDVGDPVPPHAALGVGPSRRKRRVGQVFYLTSRMCGSPLEVLAAVTPLLSSVAFTRFLNDEKLSKVTTSTGSSKSTSTR
ncbi:hypothetical protein C8N35_101865 [Breoghania corrubedonensis]|uniref:Uncharacterized protein n=1 Tax=Breoghania corrubedonensis TaxID=665038 RepID=A0A2T5VGD1_9HYPH|nr:hypothetical protein C8N35_101865 [Breoghania corrubedonensis]